MIESMLESVQLFPWAYAGGLLIAATCAAFGVLVILRRVVFIGITLAEVAACGIALALSLHAPPFLGAAVLTLATAVYVAKPVREDRVPRDAVLGVIFVAAFGVSILVVSRSGFGLHEVKSLLYGDLILTSSRDMAVIVGGMVPALGVVLLFFRPILDSLTDADYARVLGLRVRGWETLFFIALSLAVSAASKTAGSMLVFAYLVVLPAAALLLSRRLKRVVLIAVALNAAATIAGLFISYLQDLPANPTIIAVAVAAFAVSAILSAGIRFARSCQILR